MSDSVERIKQLMQILEQARNQMEATSKQAKNLDSVLGRLTTEVTASYPSFGGIEPSKRVMTQVDKILDAVHSHTKQRIALMGHDIRTSLLSSLSGAETPTPVPVTPALVPTPPVDDADESIRRFQEGMQREADARRRAQAEAIANMPINTAPRGRPRRSDPDPIDPKDVASQIAGGQVAANKAYSMAAKYGFQVEDLKKVTTEASTGISKLSFEASKADGVWNKLSVTVDKFGNVLADKQVRFRGFFEGIGRNFMEGLKWAVAVSAIYGPLQKLSELTQLAVKNEAELANISIILGRSQKDLGDVFGVAAQAANATGESIDGVLEGYTLAYRATGRYADETERAAVTQQLLTDALVLSSLSSLDQAGAMDTLVGALNQVGLGLDQGSVLLNKWVAVTKVANVDLTTLAESFAITSASAENAGLSYDELNGIIATISESTTLSATEAGNAVRAFISGFQTDNAKNELARFGIAVEDTDGKMRGFMDIMLQIRSMYDSGLISNDQLNKIGEAIGGGARRGAQVVTTITNLHRAQAVAAVSAEATNEAYDAMGTRLDTVQSHLTRLSNAFQSLAQSLGTEGGLLDALKVVLTVAQEIVEALDAMTRALGPALPMVATLSASMAYLNNTGRMGAAKAAVGGFVGDRIVGFGGSRQAATKASSFVGNNLPNMAIGLSEAFMLAMNIKEKDWEGLFGQALGGALGFVAGGPFGMMIGSAIGDTFANTVFGYEPEFANLFKGMFPGQEDEQEGPNAPTEAQLAQEDAMKALFDPQNKGAIFESISKGIFSAGSWVTNAIVDLNQLFGRDVGPKINPEIFSLLWANDADMDRINRAKGMSEIEGISEGGVPKMKMAWTDRVTEKYTENAATINRLIAESEDKLRQQLNDQEITKKAFESGMDDISTSGANIIQVYTAVGDVFGSTGETLEALTRITIDSGEDQINYINSMVEEIAKLENKIVELRGQGLPTQNEQTQQGQMRQQLNDYITGLYASQRRQRANLPSIVDYSELSRVDYQKVVERAMELQHVAIQAAIAEGMVPDDVTENDIISAFEDLFVRVAGTGYEKLSGVGSQFLSQAKTALDKEGQLASSQFSVQTVDASRPDFLSAYQRMESFITSSFPQYQLDPKEMGIIFQDNVTDVLHLDNLIMQLAMQELIDLNRKQVVGIYNLPTDASFFVPFQGYMAGFGDGGQQEKPGLPDVSVTQTQVEEQIQAEADASQKATTGYVDRKLNRMFQQGDFSDRAATSRVVEDGLMMRFQRWDLEQKMMPKTGITKQEPFAGPPVSTLDWMSKLGTLMNNIFPYNVTGNGMVGAGPVGIPSDNNFDLGKLLNTLTKGIATSLNLGVSTNVQLVVDGQTLANVMRQYMYEDLVRYDGTAGSATRVFSV